MGGRARPPDLLRIGTPKAKAEPPELGGRALSVFQFAAILGDTRSNRRRVFVRPLSLFERVTSECARLRRGYAARFILGQDRFLAGFQAIAKLVHIETSSPGLGEDPVRAPLLFVNVMLDLFRQHLDLGVVEFLIWSARE